MEVNKVLKVTCAVIWALVILLGVLIVRIIYNSNYGQMQTVTITDSANSGVQVIGNNNTINVYVTPQEAAYGFRPEYITRMMNVRMLNNDTSFTMADAISLLNKITKHASEYNIPLIDALILVNVESDFKVDAKAKGTTATGLCQVTKICLDEYNNRNSKGNKYSMDDMKDADRNLEVGFWYFDRLLNNDIYGRKYHILDSRDAYIAYNLGVSIWKDNLTVTQRDTFRGGRYAKALYGSKAGEKYTPVIRYDDISNAWL